MTEYGRQIEASDRFIVVRSELPRERVLDKLEASDALWVLVRYPFRERWLLLARDEALRILTGPQAWPGAQLAHVLLGERQRSVRLESGWRHRDRMVVPMGEDRFVRMDRGRPVAVVAMVDVPLSDLSEDDEVPMVSRVIGFESAREPPEREQPEPDEGESPVRFPSIEPEGAVAPGQPVTLVVDLRRAPGASTLGALAMHLRDSAWTEVAVTAVLHSAAIEFEAGGACVLHVRRNADTLQGTVQGRVLDDVCPGATIEVRAMFVLGTRYCGEAVRRIQVAASTPSPAPYAPASSLRLEPRAPQPDLIVTITVTDPNTPGKMHWGMHTNWFPGRPESMHGNIDLGGDPGAAAARLLDRLAKQARKAHGPEIAAAGEMLWRLAPPAFHALYWALLDHHGDRALTIQFVTDDPHMPWELMLPARASTLAQGALALRHHVARWPGGSRGFLGAPLQDGSMVAIAPRYKRANLAAPDAVEATQRLAQRLGAQQLDGTVAALMDLLTNPPASRVALLYFAGHGAYPSDDPAEAAIALEDGKLSASVAASAAIELGRKHGTVVFLNACEVGASGSVFGATCGFAQAFMSRMFGGLIAPLWRVDVEDANRAAEFVMRLILEDCVPIAQALATLRHEHGGTSPSFHAYVFYGDVTARLGRIIENV
ncbi:CHAT domain-containing protein [Massilia rhizosphaerae]|uniref:CHAT domain-containing protein n=1 Tax=Massilia rhizosphaerae TaxID=2784389 RepID=UPI0018DDB937